MEMPLLMKQENLVIRNEEVGVKLVQILFLGFLKE